MQNIIPVKNIVSSRIKQYYRKLSDVAHVDLYLFFLSICLIVLLKCIQFPSLTYNAEVFAESGSNFFIHAYKETILTNLLIPDAGYLPLTQRILALLSVKLVSVISWYPYLTQSFAILFIAFASSLINLKQFKLVSSSQSIRFLLGISVGLISDYELNAFINFIYYGALILFLLFFINKEKVSVWIIYLLGIVSALFVLSKGQLVVFLPAYLLLALYHFLNKEYKSLTYYAFPITASFVQLGIMSKNGAGLLSHQSIGDFFYYGLKTIYYFLLTYKHVFFGYVSKENITILSIVLLFIVFALAIKKLIEQGKYTLLYIFILGNFIALCSLTLTVIISNSSKNTSQKTASVQTKVSTLAVPQNTAPKNETMVTTIFDDKHHANLRSLFISNLLIFLSGILVLLTLVPQKKQKVFLLLFFCITSGAFAQIKAEEAYPTRDRSFSQWHVYHRFLANPHYCIPLNPYPFLLEEKCEMLLYKKEALVNTHQKVTSIKLSTLTKEASTWNIQGVILINAPDQFEKMKHISLVAYNVEGEIIGKAKQVVPGNFSYLYFLFDNPLASVEMLEWKDQKGKTIAIYPNVSVFGTNKQGTKKLITY